MHDAHPHPLIISFVSGKGGVGKTMLAVACAKELSLNNRTLIIDLDFFNRGLTGLLGTGTRECGEIDKPNFLSNGQQTVSETWSIVQVSENLFHIYYPDLLQDDMQKFETLDVEVLKKSLQQFVKEAAAKCDCDCVVIDCHGGPDNSSFAACLISDYSLLISEPDRITFYGTLNFVRQLKRVGGEQKIDLRLVFNKVVPAFSGLFLRNFYDGAIKEHFDGRQLLALFPLEVYLTKEFEKTPFLTSVYPYSWLAKKTRLMLYDLLRPEHNKILSPAIRTIPNWIRAYRRLSLGKAFPLLNMNVIMPTIVACLVIYVLLGLTISAFYSTEENTLPDRIVEIRLLQCLSSSPTLASDPARVRKLLDSHYSGLYLRQTLEDLPERDAYLGCVYPDNDYYYEARGATLKARSEILSNKKPVAMPDELREIYNNEVEGLKNISLLYRVLKRAQDMLDPYIQFLLYLAVVWLAIALLSNWTSELDKKFTYYCRLNNYSMILLFSLIVSGLWFAPTLLGAVGLDYIRIMSRSRNPGFVGHQEIQAIILAGLGALTVMIISLNQMFRVYRDFRYERHYLEDLLRVAFLVYLIGAPILWLRVFMR